MWTLWDAIAAIKKHSANCAKVPKCSGNGNTPFRECTALLVNVAVISSDVCADAWSIEINKRSWVQVQDD